jgi:hypothetical protein
MSKYVVTSAPHHTLRSLATSAGVDMYEQPVVLTSYDSEDTAIEVVLRKIASALPTDGHQYARVREGMTISRGERVTEVRLSDDMHAACGHERGRIGWSEPTFRVQRADTVDMANRIVPGVLPAEMA